MFFPILDFSAPPQKSTFPLQFHVEKERKKYIATERHKADLSSRVWPPTCSLVAASSTAAALATARPLSALLHHRSSLAVGSTALVAAHMVVEVVALLVS